MLIARVMTDTTDNISNQVDGEKSHTLDLNVSGIRRLRLSEDETVTSNPIGCTRADVCIKAGPSEELSKREFSCISDIRSNYVSPRVKISCNEPSKAHNKTSSLSPLSRIRPFYYALTGQHRGSRDSEQSVDFVHQDGKKFKLASKNRPKKVKPPNISKELMKCREERNDYLDLADMDLQQLPSSSGLLRDFHFVTNLYLYDNKLVGLPSNISHLVNLRKLSLQNNRLECSKLPVELSKLIKLEYLDLRNNRLSGSLPDCVCNLVSLEQLILSYNKLTNMDGVTRLKQLSVLVVAWNSLKGGLPESIDRLTRLATLDVSQNHISSIPDSIGRCTTLHRLDLQGNEISRLPETIGQLTNLCKLELKYNRLVELPACMQKCQNLEKLNVENNQLNSLPDSLLCRLPRLDSITLSRNQFASFPPGGPDQFTVCYTINMDNNQITEIPSGIFARATVLTKLNLASNHITSLAPEDLCHLKSLVELDLGLNQLTHLPEEIESLQGLEVLRLNYNQLTTLPEGLGKLGKLRVLDLESNQLESLPSDMSGLTDLQELIVLSNRLTSFPKTIGQLPKLKIIKASDNDIREIPREFGSLSRLQCLNLSDNRNLNSLPDELSLCHTLVILNLMNCPLRNLPPEVIDNGPSMILYFLQHLWQLRRQQMTM